MSARHESGRSKSDVKFGFLVGVLAFALVLSSLAAMGLIQAPTTTRSADIQAPAPIVASARGIGTSPIQYYYAGDYGPDPTLLANVSDANVSATDALQVATATGSGLSYSNLNALVDNQYWQDPVTVLPGSIAVPTEQAAPYNYTDNEACMNPATGAATGGCNLFSQPSNWQVSNWSTNATVSLSRSVSPVTNLPQLTAAIIPQHAQAGYADVGLFGISVPVRDLSPVSSDSYLNVQVTTSGPGSCLWSVGPPAGWFIPKCSVGLFVASDTSWHVPPGPAGGLFETSCAYATCARQADYIFGSHASGINVTAAGIPEPLRGTGQDLNDSTAIMNGDYGTQDVSIPLSVFQAIGGFGSDVSAYSNLTLGVWTVFDGYAAGERFVNVTGLFVNGLQDEPYVPGVSAAPDSGNHTGGWTGKWTAGETNMTEVATDVSSSPIILANGIRPAVSERPLTSSSPLSQQEFELAALAPTWPSAGSSWIGGGGLTVAVEQQAASLAVGSQDGASGVIVTPSGSGNTIPSREADYSFYERLVPNGTYSVNSVSAATVVDPLHVAANQYLAVSTAVLDTYPSYESWPASLSLTGGYQAYASSTLPQYAVNCGARYSIIDTFNASGTANFTGDTSTACAGTMTVGNAATVPGSYEADEFVQNYTVAYTAEQWNTTICDPFPSSAGCLPVLSEEVDGISFSPGAPSVAPNGSVSITASATCLSGCISVTYTWSIVSGSGLFAGGAVVANGSSVTFYAPSKTGMTNLSVIASNLGTPGYLGWVHVSTTTSTSTGGGGGLITVSGIWGFIAEYWYVWVVIIAVLVACLFLTRKP